MSEEFDPEARLRRAGGVLGDRLSALSDEDAEFSRLAAQQRRVQAEIDRFRADDRLDRDELHFRGL